MASGILVGTIFVNLVKLHRIEEICGECMVIGLPIENVVKTCIYFYFYTSMNLTMKSTKIGAQQLQ